MLSLINSESADPQKQGRGTEGGVIYECAGGGNRRGKEKRNKMGVICVFLYCSRQGILEKTGFSKETNKWWPQVNMESKIPPVRIGSGQPFVSWLNGRGKVTTIIGNRVALGKRLSPFNGANAADPDKRREGKKNIHSQDWDKIGPLKKREIKEWRQTVRMLTE